MAVAALAQRGITAAAERVVLSCQARPMIERVREPLIAGITAHDDAGLPLRRVTGATPDRLRKA